MKIQDIATQFRKAGVNARPKSLKTVLKAIKEVEEALREKEMDVDMEEENDRKKSNDFDSPSNSAKVVQYFIKRFKEIKNCGGNSKSNILELNTAEQIYVNLTLQDLEEDKAQDDTKPFEKDFKSMIISQSKKIEEDKDKKVEDPSFEYLNKNVIILDSFNDIPSQSSKIRIPSADSSLKEFHGKSILSSPDSRTKYFQNRIRILEDELMKDPRFVRPTILDTNVKEKRNEDIVPIHRLNAALGTTDKIYCIGILVSGEDGNLHIEDDTLKMKLNLTKARSERNSYFTEGSIVIVEGANKSGTFWADCVYQPPMIEKPSQTAIAEDDKFGAYTFVKNNIMNDIEKVTQLAIQKKEGDDAPIDENEGIVVLSNISLDEPEIIDSLERIFSVYEAMENINTFVLCGEFISLKKADSLDFEGIKFCFDELARVIKKNMRLRME